MAGQLLTVKEAAVYWSVHPMTIYRLVWDEEIPYVNLAKPGKRTRIRISKAVLDEYAEKRESMASAA